ncbi:MAG: ester cyclase [Dehalococcoidales bacterium]|nr:ester cyclase [Dehalococcoidales bacterium]
MSIKENKNLVRHVVDLWNKRDMEGFFKLCAPEYIEHLPTGDVTLEQLKQFAPRFYNAFPDIIITIKDMTAEGDKVAALVNWQATHRGEYMGIPATGRKIDINVAILIKVAGGKWIEFWNVTDIGLAKQLGAVPNT